MTSRRRERIMARQRLDFSQYHERMLQGWLDSVRSEHKGFSLDRDLYRDCWDDRIKKSTVRTLKKYAKNPSEFLILKGEAGLGKSALAVTLATHMFQELGLVPLYRSLPRLLMQFSFPGETNPIDECSRAHVLIIDDVGAAAEGISVHQEKCLWALIDNRWGTNNRHTIMTTNMSITSNEEGQGLRSWFGPSAWDRIQHDMMLVEFYGDSFRL